MTVKTYLSQALVIDRQIDAKLEKVIRLRAKLTRCTSVLSGMPRGGGSDWTAIADKVIVYEAELTQEIDRLIDLKRDIMSAINAIPRQDYRELLEYRYLCGWSWARIAGQMRFSEDWVKHMHGYALQALKLPRTR